MRPDRVEDHEFRSAPNPLASIIIIVSSPVDRLLACLASVRANAPPGISYEIVVVLNRPVQAQVDRLRAAVSDTTIIVSAANLGLAGGANRARQSARGEYIVLLHDDTEVEPGWLEALVATAEANPHAGAVGSRQLWPDGSFQAAGLVLWSNAAGTSPWLTKPLPTSARRVDVCGTASLLVRASAWDAIGGLDERFYPAYYVDSDLCLALYRAGFVVLVEPASCIRHWRAESSRSSFRQFLMERHWALFSDKWRDALSKQETCDSGDLASSIDRALARLNAQRSMPHSMDRDTNALGFDVEQHERRHIERERDVLAAYADYLDGRLRASAIPLYEGGTDLSFAAGGNAFRYVVAEDTYPPEDWGAWIKQSCRIFLPLVEDETIGNGDETVLTLAIAARHFCCGEKRTSAIRVCVDGVEVLSERVSVDGNCDHTIVVSKALRPQGSFIVIDNQEARSPLSLGCGTDERALGLGLRSLRLDVASARQSPARLAPA